VGKIFAQAAREVAKMKLPDLTAADLEAAVRTIAGSARSWRRRGRSLIMALAKRMSLEENSSGKQYPVDEALKLVKEFATAKFAESVDAAVNLGIDASKSDQQVRGSTVMPHGIGKSVRVAVFTSGKNQELAKAAGADIVGLEDLAAKVKAGEINFDVVVASPTPCASSVSSARSWVPADSCRTRRSHGDTERGRSREDAKAGQVRYRVDKAGSSTARSARRLSSRAR